MQGSPSTSPPLMGSVISSNDSSAREPGANLNLETQLEQKYTITGQTKSDEGVKKFKPALYNPQIKVDGKIIHAEKKAEAKHGNQSESTATVYHEWSRPPDLQQQLEGLNLVDNQSFRVV